MSELLGVLAVAAMFAGFGMMSRTRGRGRPECRHCLGDCSVCHVAESTEAEEELKDE